MSIQSYANIEVPPGVMWDFAGPTAPAGWLLCDGTAYSRTTYANLYANLGGASSPWGQGDGSTTFNVPDLRGRTAIGAGQGSGLTNRSLGQTFGEEQNQHTHSINNHYHTLSGAGYALLQMSASLLAGQFGSGNSYTYNTKATSFAGQAASAAVTGIVNLGGTTDNGGLPTNAPSDPMAIQPSAVVTKIIKT